MDPNLDLAQILTDHATWQRREGGKCADLRGADLHDADLSDADLSYADLRRADLRYADLRYADLRRANLSRADLRSADLSSADLRDANLRSADLSGADLRGANLRGADLSGAQGLLNASDWLRDHFETDAAGVIVWKRLGATEFPAPACWVIEPGAVLEEVVNPLPTLDCACGVNFGTRAWCENNYKNAALWKCRIVWADLAGVVVPYNTDGKARCARLTLLECISTGG